MAEKWQSESWQNSVTVRSEVLAEKLKDDKELWDKTVEARARLRKLYPTVRFVTDPLELCNCNNWDVDLSRLPSYCTDYYIQRMLQATDCDVTEAVSRAQHGIDLDISTRGTQSPGVQQVMQSKRYRYLGHSRKGMTLLCCDCMWGKMLDVEGGLESVMQGLKVFYCRKLRSAVERDLGRVETLTTTRSVGFLLVGGTPPVSFVRAALQWINFVYPGALKLVAMFESNRFRGVLAEGAFKFLPKDGTRYVWTHSRERLLEILDVEEHIIPNNILGLDVSDKEQLSSTASIDRDWGEKISSAAAQGIDEMEATERVQASVKNTFVELVATEEFEESPKRGRAHSDDDLPYSGAMQDKDKSPHKRENDGTEASIGSMEVKSEGIIDQLTIGAEPKTKSRGKRNRASGWTRQRRSRREQQKATEEVETLSFHSAAGSQHSDGEGGSN